MDYEVNEIIRKNKLKRVNTMNNHKKNVEYLPHNLKYIKGLISRFLLAVIFVLVSVIYTNFSEKNKSLYQKYVLENSLEFTKINNLYQSIFGKVDITNKKSDSTSVSSNEITYTNIESFENSSKLTVGKNETIHVITSGIVVFVGEKDNLGNTIIVQGNDGVDIWYSNITNTDIKVYDYVEKNSILGTNEADYIYLTICKDGKYMSYEEYKNLI